jgi:hypothetical protein
MIVTELILPRLSGVQSCGDGRWRSRCPAHPDRTPSLTVRQLPDRALMYCFAGCSIEDICAAIGLTVADLYETRRLGHDGIGYRPYPTVEDSLQEWSEFDLKRVAGLLRTLDSLRWLMIEALKLGSITEDDFMELLKTIYVDERYSELEFRFEQLLRGENLAELWRTRNSK